MDKSPVYRNLISSVDFDRGIDSIEYLNFREVDSESKFWEFLNDINLNNDIIELNLIRNKAYKEAVVMTLKLKINETLLEMIKGEQKTFGGSKLFYLNNKLDKILIISIPSSLEGKISMVITRLNKINEKISRLNTKIKKDNLEAYMKRQNLKDKKDLVANMINEKLKV